MLFVTSLHTPDGFLPSQVHPFVAFTPVGRGVSAKVAISKITFGEKKNEKNLLKQEKDVDPEDNAEKDAKATFFPSSMDQ